MSPDVMGVPYYLSNEGTGPAFNVEHGVEVAGHAHVWEHGAFAAMRPGEFVPPIDTTTGQPVSVSPLVVAVELDDWHGGEGLAYWTRFENLLGERFEVRRYPELTRPAEFRRLSELPSRPLPPPVPDQSGEDEQPPDDHERPGTDAE